MLGSAIFGAISGSATAAVATIGAVGTPAFRSRPQYDFTKALGSMGGGSVLGIMIPPSISMIIYGLFGKEKFLIGIVLAMFLIILIDQIQNGIEISQIQSSQQEIIKLLKEK